MTVDYDALVTEQQNRAFPHVDELSVTELVDAIHRGDREAMAAVGRARDQIAHAIEVIQARLATGGRLLYVGAGTSGRLGLLDAAECPPTFNTPIGQVTAELAGGSKALTRAAEGAEDSRADGRAIVRKQGVGQPDVVCGITASGVTPFVIGALAQARQRRCATIIITCAPPELVARQADVVISLAVGPEIIAGSTRMKAGLATKAVLHTLTTATMVRLGKVFDNLMIDVRPTSRKLQRRAVRIIATLTELSPRKANALLRRAGDSPKVAVLMHRKAISRADAEKLLAANNGFLRPALAATKGARKGRFG